MAEKQFDSEQFLQLFTEKINGTPTCRYCGHRDYSLAQDLVQFISQKAIHGLNLNQTMPAAAVICKNCGHIDFFALGAYGLLNTNEEISDGKEKQETANR